MSRDWRERGIGGRSRLGRRVAFTLALAAAVAAAWVAWNHGVRAYRALGRGVELARAGRHAEAERLLRPLGRHPLFGTAARDGLGLVALLQGDLEEARRRFEAAGISQARFSPLALDEAVLDLLDRGDYERAEVLAAHARSRGDSPTLRMYHGVALNGLDRTGPAREAMAQGPLRSVFERVKRGDTLLVGGVFRDQRVLELYANHVKSLVEKERSGRRAWLYDGRGKPLFRILVKSGERVGLDVWNKAACVGPEGEGGGVERFTDALDRRNRVETTLDPEMQRLAYEALRNYRGALVVLGLDGAVLAAAARDNLRHRKLRGGVPDERPTPDPFATAFPIASVAKVPALAAALATPGAVESVFPLVCKGVERIEGTTLYDSRRHGEVADPGWALAQSCNLAFARLSLAVGRERLLETFAGFGFGRDPEDPLQPRPLALLAEPVTEPRAVAELGVGFGAARATVVGTAAVTLAIATRGEYREPFVFRRKATIGGRVYAEARPASRRILPGELADRVAQAMTRVVTDPEATGRHARHEILTLAAKTGTLGNDREGYHALLAGFVPATGPRFAFAVYLNGTGRAEWDAAMVTKVFLDGLYALEEERRREQGARW